MEYFDPFINAHIHREWSFKFDGWILEYNGWMIPKLGGQMWS